MFEMFNDKKILFLNLDTWNNESNNIFDFTSNSIKNIKAYIAHSTYVVRTKNDIFLYIEQHADIQNNNGDVLIFHVNNSISNIYNLMNPIPKNLKLKESNFDYLNNKIWYVLKTVDLENHDIKPNSSNEEYYLNQNDIIKIGKVKYAVQKIHLLKNNKSNGIEPPPMAIIETKYKISESNKIVEPVFEFIFPVKICKNYTDINEKNKFQNEKLFICELCKEKNINQEADNDEPDLLISICKCKNLFHFKCLKNHIKGLQVKSIENKNITIYDEAMTFENFECHKCKNQYPIKFKLEKNDKIFYLIDIKEPTDCNFMILESIDYKQNDKYCKSIHIIKFLKKNGEPFTFGRDNDNDIIDRDISISRQHAILRFNDENGRITIQNWNGKYGTLILIRKPFKILDKSIYLQVGKTYIEAKLKNKEEYDKIKKEKKKINQNIEENLNKNNDENK